MQSPAISFDQIREIIAIADMYTANALVRTCRELARVAIDPGRYTDVRSHVGVYAVASWSCLPNGKKYGIVKVRRQQTRSGTRDHLTAEYDRYGRMICAEGALPTIRMAWRGSRTVSIVNSPTDGWKHCTILSSADHAIIDLSTSPATISVGREILSVDLSALPIGNPAALLAWYNCRCPDPAPSVRPSERMVFLWLGPKIAAEISDYFDWGNN